MSHYREEELRFMADMFMECLSKKDPRCGHMMMALQMFTGMNQQQIIYKIQQLQQFKYEDERNETKS